MSKHLKRLLALLLAVVMIVGMFPTVVFAADEAEPETRDLPDSYIVGEDEVPACEPVDEGLPADFNIEDVETELSDGRKLGKIPDLHPGDHELVSSGAKRGTLPATYNSNDYNYITAVKNQGNFGTCWAHGALASCEAYMIKNGVKVDGVASTKSNINLSEYQLAYYAYHDAYDALGLLAGDKTTPLDDYLDLGGNGWIATYDLMRWEGPVDEVKTPAMNYLNASNSAKLGSTYAYDYNVGHVQDAIWIPTKNMSDIKQAIMTYGAGTFGYCHDDEYENESNGAYYNPNDDYSNHDVTVVGWNDNYAVNNFKSAHRPSKPGAWIIKNSWGDTYGTSGYYYISYYDVPSLDDYCYFYVVEPVDNYDHNYQYDGTANIDENSYISAPNNAKFANVFTAQGNSGGKELLEAVAVNVWDTNTSFRIQIYTGGTGTATPESGTLAATQDVSFTYEGYHTVKLNTPVTLNEGEKFSVIFQNTSGKTIHMPIDKSVTISGWLSTTKNHPSNSTYYSTGSSGGTTTYANYSSTGNLRIKAYTSDVEAQPEPCTITLKDNQGNTWRTISATTGTAAELPVYPVGSNTDFTFVGWLASAISNETTTSKPTGLCELSGGVYSYTPTRNVTLYPCFTTEKTVTGGASNSFEKFSGTVVEGDYLITHDGTTAMEATVSSDRLGYKTVTPVNNIVTNPDAKLIWHIAISDSYVTIYNASVDKYAASTGAKNKAALNTSATDNKSLWTVSGSSTYEFVNKQNTTNNVNKNLRYNSGYGFAAYSTSTGKALTLYKAAAGGSTTQTIYVTTASLCNHTYSQTDSVAPTCTETGIVEYTCSKCGDSYLEETPATGHNWGSWTPVNDLVHERSCTVSGCDGHEEASHNYTISTSGLTTTYTCTLCNHSYTRTLKSYTVNFSVLGSVTDSASCTEGESVVLPATATSVEGYAFRGWVAAAVDPETETQPSILTGTYAPSGDNTTITLYALYSRIEGATSGGGDYTLVTSDTQLVTGSKVIIAAAGYNYALSTTQNGNNRGQASITKDTVNDTCTITSGVAELTLLAGNETGTYAFYDPANNGYLYAPTGGNYLRTAETLNDWTITFTNGVPTLADGTRYLRYNNSASLFSGYGSGQADVSLYIQAGSAGTTYFTTNPAIPCVHEHKTEYPAVAATCTTAGSAYYFLCTDCGNYYNGNGVKIGEDAVTAAAAAYIAALGHTWNGTVTQIADDDEYHNVECSVCHNATQPAPHTFGAPTVNGLTQTETCTACGYVKTSELEGWTVTYNVLGKDAQKVTVAKGSSVTLPTTSAAIVNATESGYTFAGWVTAAIPEKNNTTNPGTPMTGSYTPTGNVTLYALYTKTDSTTTEITIPAGYSLATDVPAVGNKIIIALKNGSDYYALPNGNKSSSNSIAGTKITVTNGVATSANTYTFEVYQSNGNLGIKSTEAGNYLGFNSNKISMNGWGDTKYAAIAKASGDGLFTISSSNNAPRGLSYNGTSFTVNNSGASPVYIFKYQAGGTQETTTTTNYYTTQPAAAKYIVTAGTCTNGSVAITDPQADYAAGAQVTLTATPATGFAFSAWSVTGTVNGQDYTSAISGTILTVPAADVTVTATFIPVSANEYTVDTTDITGSGSVTADPNVGEEETVVTLTVTPAEHYHLTELIVDGDDVTEYIEDGKYTFELPDHNVIVSATFAEDAKYTVTLNPVTGGTISASKTADIYAGEEITVTANPAAHYTFEEFNFTGLGGTEWSADDNVLTFIMPANNVTVTPSFTEDAKYTVTIDSEIENGTVTASPSADIYAGDTVTLTATPDAHYTFGAWQTTPSVTVGADGKFTMPASNVTVSATFIEDPKATVTFSVIGDTEAIEAVTDYVGEALVLPDTVTVEGLDEDYSFIGWATTSTDGEDVKTLARVNPEGYKIPATDTVLYAVFTRTEAGGSAASLTKMAAGDTLADGDKIVVVANGTTLAMYQETTNSSYVNNYTFDGAVNTVLANDKNYFTVNTVTGGFTLGDATNGYLYNSSSNDLKVDKSNSTTWTLTDKGNGTFNIIGSNRWLSCRTDLTTSNKDLWRMGGSTTGTGSGTIALDLYKVTEGSSSTTYYNTDPEVIHKYTLTVDTGIANGSVSVSPVQAEGYVEGDSVTLSYTADTGYRFDGYVLTKDEDDSDVTAAYISGSTLTMPAFDVTLSAIFSLIPATYYSVTPTYNAAGGSISVSPSSAEVEDLITVTIAPNAHWTLTSLTVNGEAVDLSTIENNRYIFELEAPAEGKDVPVVAVFTEDAYRTLTLTAPENGVIRATWNGETYTPTTETPIVLNHVYVGDEITLTTAETTAHWHFSEWDGVTVTENSFTMPDADVELTAVFAEEDRIPVIFHSYDTEAAPVTVTVSDKYYSGDAVLAADVPAIAEPNGYVFKGWYTASYEDEAAPTYVTPAGTQIGSEALHFYAVYGVLSEGSSLYFKLCVEVESTTYYVGGRTGSNKYLDSTDNAANAAQFGIDAGGYLYYTDGETKTYVSNKSNAVDLSFSTNKSDAMPWTVNETASGISFTTTAAGEREFAYNKSSPRFAAYQGNNSSYPYIFTKIGGPSYDSFTTDPARVTPELTAENFTVIFDRDRALTFDVWAHIGLDYLKKDQVTLTFAGRPANAVDNGDGTVTFTPTANQAEVSFTYTVTDNADSTNFVTKTVTLKPAERVYYDESDTEMFTFVDGDKEQWQTVFDQSLSNIDDIFAYEKENFVMYSGNTAKQVTVVDGDKPYVEFDFAGTGVEIVAAMTNTSGAAKIDVFDQGGNKVKGAIVDAFRGYTYNENSPVTKYTLKEVVRYALVNEKYVAYTGAEDQNLEDFTYYRDYVDGAATKSYVENEGKWYAVPKGTSVGIKNSADAFESYINADGTYVLVSVSSNWVPTTGSGANTYQVPVLRAMGLTYGTYTVKVSPIYSDVYDRDLDGSYDFIFDGVNIYDPANDADYKYISLNDIVAEQGFGSVVIENDCDHPTSDDWTFAAPATGTAEGSFAKYCTECEAVTASAKFTATATAEPTVITAGATSALTCTLTSENQEVQAILDAAVKTAAWTSSDSAVLTVDGSTATGVAEGTAYATLTLTVGGTTYASGINTAMITVNAAPTGFTATFHVPEGATAPAAITQTGASITLPDAVDAPASCDAHTYTFEGWVKSEVAYNDASFDPTTILAAGAADTLTANTDFYALYTYQVGGGSSSTPQTFAQFMSDSTKTSGEFVIAANVGGTYKAMSNTFASKIDGTTITVTDGAVASADAGSYKVTIEKNDSSYTISNGSSYLTYSSSTNLGTSSSKYNWSIASGVKGTYRFNSTTSGRGLVYRAGSTDQFGGYATSNVTAGGTEYYDVEVLPIGGGSGGSATYYTTDPGHKVFDTESATAATCTEDGYTGDVICSECGMKLGDGDAIPALGHNYEITSDPNELDTTYTCSVCDDSYIEYYEYAVTYVLQTGVEVSGGSRNVNAITLPTAASIPNTYDAQTYTLVGWANATSADGTTDPSTYEPGDVVNISADTTFYPVYSFGSGSGSSYTLTDSLTDGDYMFGATYSSAIVVPNATTESGWLKYESFVPSNGVITNTDSLYVWTLTNQTDGGFTLKNKSTGDYFYVKSSTGSGTVTTDTNAHTVYATVAVAANKSFEIHDSSSATTSSGNQVTFNYNGNNGGYRNYAERATSDSMPNQFTFYKGSSGTTTYTFELQQKAPHYTATISPATLSLTFGASATLTATLCNNLVPVAAESVEFSSSNDSIVLVDENTGYLVAGNTAGSATITVEMLAADGEIYSATCTVYVSEESDDITVNYIGSETGKVYNWGTRGTVATFLTAPTTGYYTGSYSYETLAAMSGDSGTGTDFYGSQLGSAIHLMLVAKQTTQTTYDGTKNLYAYTDCIESDTAHISGYYTGKTLSSTWDSGSTWNREHVWPSSKCINTNHGADGADIMMLRPESASDNSGRGNTAFGESSGYYNPDAKYLSKAANVRGDVARNVLYTLMRWGNTTKFYGTGGVMESRAILLKWMNEDPVDTWELARNDAAQRITGVRNIFVDYPELAYKLLGATMPDNYSTPSSRGIVAKATYSATRPSDYEPVTMVTGGTPNNAARTAPASSARGTAMSGSIGGLVVVDGKGNISTAEDFKEYGPNYGVYLAPGQALVFKLSGKKPTEMAIGAKAINSTPAELHVASLNSDNALNYLRQQPIASAVEQYYTLDLTNLNWNSGKSDTIIVYNAGTGVLDVTNLRYKGDEAIDVTVGQKEAQKAARMIRIVYGAPITEPDPIDPSETAFRFNSASLALQSDIGMIFYVDEAVMNSAENVYASFTKALYNNAGEITGYAEANDYTAEYDEDLGKYFFRFDGINPAEMGSAVTATLHGTRNGEPISGKTVDYSVLSYINRKFAQDEDAELRTLLADLAAYGAAAQNYIGRTASLITDRVAEGLMAYATQQAPALNSCTELLLGEDAPVTILAASLSLREKVTVRYTFDLADLAADSVELRITYTDIDGAEKTAVISGSDFAEQDGKYIASFSELNALQMRTVLSATVYAGDTCVSDTLLYSIESYAASKAAGNDALAELVSAMMTYGDAACAYFAQ